MSDEHALHGFTNGHLRTKLAATSFPLHPDAARHSAQTTSRLLHRLHLYGLIAKIPRSRRWRVTAFGHRAMSASVRLRQRHFPAYYAKAA